VAALPVTLRWNSRLLLIGTARSEEIAPDHPLYALLYALQRDGSMTELDLAPLSASETAELATQVAGRPLHPTQAQHLYAETEGNPLFVVEIVRAMEPAVASRDPVAETAPSIGTNLPSTVQAVIKQRLAQLSPQSRELVGLAATSDASLR